MINKIRSEYFPTEQEMFQWIEDLCRYPHRRTGTKEGFKAAEYIKTQFESFGLQDVKIESTPSSVFHAENYFLQVEGQDIPCFMINGTLHPEEFGEFSAGKICENTEMVYLGEGRAADFQRVNVKDKVVLCDCPWTDMDETIYAKTWCKTEALVYDPDGGQREKLRKTDSYSPNAWPYNYLLAQKNGAAGFVGVLNDYFRDGVNWNEDYSEIAQSQGADSFAIPGLWIGTDAFQKIKPWLKRDQIKVSMGLKTSYRKGEARNVSGILPGATDETILIHSHYDAVFNGAVQDASGMSEVLAIAKYFASAPQERKKTLMFAGLDGHYTDYAGHKAFLKTRQREGRNLIFDFVIEHIGKEVGLGPENEAIVSEDPELRLMYVTDMDDAVNSVYSKITKYDIKRTIILPVRPYQELPDSVYEFQQDEVISDAYYSHINGIPIVSMLSPQMYLFHPMDTPEMIPLKELRPIGLAFAELIMGV